MQSVMSASVPAVETPTFRRARMAADRAVRLRVMAAALAARRDLRVDCADNRLSIRPVGSVGFPIAIHVDDFGCHGDFGGCRQDFDDMDDLFYCLDKALAPSTRLRIDYHHDRAYRWALEDVSGPQPATVIASGHPSLIRWLFPAPPQARYASY